MTQNSSSGRSGTSEEDLVDTPSDGIGSSLRRFVEQLQQGGIEAAGHQGRTHRLSRCSTSGRGLPKNSVAGSERLQRLHPGQEQRVVRGSEDEHDTERLAAGFRGNPAKPEGASMRTELLGREDPAGFALKKAAGLDQWQHFRNQRIGHTAMDGSTLLRGLLAGNGLRNF